jgi:hypothetical protein
MRESESIDRRRPHRPPMRVALLVAVLLRSADATFICTPSHHGQAQAQRAAVHMGVSVDKAIFLARACSLAFVPPSAIPTNPYADSLQFVAQIEDPSTQTGATVFQFTPNYGAEPETIVACRGSASIKNFQTNFNVGPDPLLTADAFGRTAYHPTAKVHAGFQKATNELWPRLQPTLPKNSGKVVLTGHSLGGGIATLLALKAREAGNDVELCTIAGPRLGNAAFCEYYKEQCGDAVTHLVHRDDDVLKSNYRTWNNLGFEHVGEVVRCEKKEPCLYEDEDGALCIADPNFTERDLGFRAVFVDHCLYMGVYIGLRAQHPSVWFRRP